MQQIRKAAETANSRLGRKVETLRVPPNFICEVIVSAICLLWLVFVPLLVNDHSD